MDPTAWPLPIAPWQGSSWSSGSRRRRCVGAAEGWDAWGLGCLWGIRCLWGFGDDNNRAGLAHYSSLTFTPHVLLLLLPTCRTAPLLSPRT